MKRLAILLAATALGSGCVVTTDTCHSGTVDVGWNLVAANGASGVACNSLNLPADVVDMDVWIDGVLAASPIGCNAFGVAIPGVPAGSHDVLVAGYDGLNNVVVRGAALVDVCDGASGFLDLGEGYMDIQPTNCEVSGDALTYAIYDVTMSPATLVDAELPGDSLTHTCGGGILERVPWGYYDLTGIEETNATGLIVYRSLCSTTFVDVLNTGTTTYPVAFTNLSGTACF